jgi:hypothetical protein
MMQRPDQIASRADRSANPAWDTGGRARYLGYVSVVVGPSADDVVAVAGGYMYDYARAGWDIIAACNDAVESNALRVLGVTPVDLNAVLKRESVSAMDRWSSARTLNTHDAILGVLRGASRDPLLDVQVFRSVPPGSGGSAPSGQMHHRLTTVARAFKQHALRSFQEPASVVDPTETFRVRTLSVVKHMDGK